MAVIKIKTIKSNLQAVINYGKNGDKTDNGILVSSVNCSVDTAYEEMALTKKFFHKEDKTLGYHIIQSFKGNEISPKTANQIGKELAEELWGDKYQVIICTHINKENVHNHLIFLMPHKEILSQPWASLVAQLVQNLPAMQETQIRSLGWEDPLEKEMATQSSILAWRIIRTEEPGGLHECDLK